MCSPRCSEGEGGGEECAELLSALDYSEIIAVMSGKPFDHALLLHTVRHGLSATMQVGWGWLLVRVGGRERWNDRDKFFASY